MITRSMSNTSRKAIRISHDTVRKMFRALTAEGRELGHLEYNIIPPSTIDFYHTFTEPDAQGQGVAGKMVTAGLEWAKEKNYKVIPSCSYVVAFLKKNPQFSSSL